jgi:N-methylhydantoinase A/oxoprolinase/acetone carboxylase beta subunit
MFSSDFVLRETRRCVQATAGSKVTVWAGFGVDVAMRNSTPESVRGAVKAVFEAGATGLIICTAHSNMRPENLSAVGSTLRELKLA